MANPQAENGHTDIANEIIEALASQRISPNEWQVLMVIFRKTYGWHKKEDGIPLSQFCETTGIHKPHVHRALKRLIQRNIVTRTGNVTRIGNDYIVNYQFQKDFDKWEPLPKLVTSYLNRQRGITRTGNKGLPKLVTSKETTKETTKEINHCVKTFIDFYFEEFKARFGKTPIIEGGKDGNLIKRLLKDIILEDLKGLLIKFFDSTDKFILGSGYTIGVFKSQINKLQIGTVKQGIFKPQPGIAAFLEKHRKEDGEPNEP